MSLVSPALNSPAELRDLRRFAATMVGHVISRLETLKWFLEESPSREQVIAWQRTVFEPIRRWHEADAEPPIDCAAQVNVQQVGRYFPDFQEAWMEWRRRGDKDQRTILRHLASQINRELADAYGQPVVHPDR